MTPGRLVADETVQASAARLRAACGAAGVPTVAVVLGSGWGAAAERLVDAVDVPAAELPAFGATGVGGHRGDVRIGTLGARRVAMLRGRRHAYERGDAGAMRGAIRTLAALGCRVVVLTNAAGSLDAANLPPGASMLIADHLNVVQASPLVGESDDRRFVDMTDAYCPALRAAVLASAERAGLTLREGVYAWVLGPQFETPAEIRWLRGIGADAVGMSTVPETILARHAGMRVVGLSMITNLGAGLSGHALSHALTLAMARRGADAAAALLAAVVSSIEA